MTQKASLPLGNGAAHALGIDIGSVAVKLAVVSSDGQVLDVRSRPILGRLSEVLGRLISQVPMPGDGIAVRIAVTGNGRELVHGRVLEESEVVALARAIPVLCAGTRTAIEIGGHSARFVMIDPSDLTLVDYGLNQQCADEDRVPRPRCLP